MARAPTTASPRVGDPNARGTRPPVNDITRALLGDGLVSDWYARSTGSRRLTYDRASVLANRILAYYTRTMNERDAGVLLAALAQDGLALQMLRERAGGGVVPPEPTLCWEGAGCGPAAAAADDALAVYEGDDDDDDVGATAARFSNPLPGQPRALYPGFRAVGEAAALLAEGAGRGKDRPTGTPARPSRAVRAPSPAPAGDAASMFYPRDETDPREAVEDSPDYFEGTVGLWRRMRRVDPPGEEAAGVRTPPPPAAVHARLVAPGSAGSAGSPPPRALSNADSRAAQREHRHRHASLGASLSPPATGVVHAQWQPPPRGASGPQEPWDPEKPRGAAPQRPQPRTHRACEPEEELVPRPATLGDAAPARGVCSTATTPPPTAPSAACDVSMFSIPRVESAVTSSPFEMPQPTPAAGAEQQQPQHRRPPPARGGLPSDVKWTHSMHDTLASIASRCDQLTLAVVEARRPRSGALS